MFFLLLCSIASAGDGPLFSIWHIKGHGYAWQQAQIEAGYPVEASVLMPSFFEGAANHPKTVTDLTADAPVLSQLDGQPIVLRMGNIGQEIDRTIPRVSPLTIDNFRTSHMCVRYKADVLDAYPTVCPWAGTSAWAEAGRQWATSAFMVRLGEIIPSPAGLILRENNEAGRVQLKDLYVRQNVRHRNNNGVLVWSDQTTPVATYTAENSDPPGSTPGIMYRIENNQIASYWWKSDALLDAIDLRAKEWVAPRRGSFPPDSAVNFTALEYAQYHALYAAFDANLPLAWQGKLRTVGYGSWDENLHNDAASAAYYLGWYRDPDLTKPGAYAVNRWTVGSAEQVAESGNPDAWREYSITAAGTKSAIYSGAVAGRHAVVDPESFAGLMTHVAWRMQSPGREVRLVYWDNYNVKPTHLVFADKTNGTALSSSAVTALTSIGRADMLALTISDYELATMQALKRIHDNVTLSRYWRDGTTASLASSLNTGTATKVYATETTIPGEAATLLYVYTPCDLAGEIDVGPYRVPSKRAAYYLTGQTVEIE